MTIYERTVRMAKPEQNSTDQQASGPPEVGPWMVSGCRHSRMTQRRVRTRPATLRASVDTSHRHARPRLLGRGLSPEGDLTDLRLGETFTAGMYACRPPGCRTGHGGPNTVS
jgi:hypothetical protein